MTLKELDECRTRLERARTLEKHLRATQKDSPAHQDAVYKETCAENEVLKALAQWWNQDCREPIPLTQVKGGA